ncbi:putative fungal pheromone GPCR, STE3-type [Suillus fuscotomentosus]|uniref:Fungal pheromone GPCR, STE3-type n=1 Tax=Suillus fuscotomentosus TaxID=1912939 RepID=A0AAD4E8V0_9AGAM|nr:putative fungal pheromone GPCR, STE3-type [Suillus fuscotomentosus]KAG1901732.1 putative fungal pheromone GPCR, STE3-type [Suillus fuscotomentosus]
MLTSVLDSKVAALTPLPHPTTIKPDTRSEHGTRYVSAIVTPLGEQDGAGFDTSPHIASDGSLRAQLEARLVKTEEGGKECVWCDITTKLEVGSTVALAAAMFSLCMHLERVAAIRDLSLTHSKKCCRQIVESTLCFGVPLIYMALHYIVQGHRFDIIECFGCRPTIYVSIASIFLIWVPPLAFSLGAGIFTATAFSHFWKRRALFSKHLKNTGSALTPSRYFRLMSMAIVEMFFGLLVTILNMWWTMRPGLRPWITWTFALWFMIPIASVFFFLFFAFGRDAVKEYGATFRWIQRHVLRVQDRPSPGLYPLITVARPCNMPQSSTIDLRNKKKGTPTGIPYSTSPCHIDLARGTGPLKSDCAPALPYTSPPASSYFKYQEQYSRGSDRDGRPSGMHAV